MVGQVEEGRLVAGRYRLVERIGRGGMGTVWLAEDELLGRRVAVKKLHPPQPHMMEDELATLFERTRREARAAARISHPNVIVVHDVVDDAGLPSIVMEYVPSVTLGERLKKHGPLPPAEVARIGRGMIAALRAAHQAGVLHRDVKPGNVLLGEEDGTQAQGYGGGRVVLTDFGIAQASGTTTLTRTGELIGSIDFLSPERIRGAMPGPEADLWALGATLFQAIEGTSPFRRPTAIETAYAIAEDPVPRTSAGPLSRVIAGLLAKEPEQRLSVEEAERMLRLSEAEQETALVEGLSERPGPHREAPAPLPAAEPPTRSQPSAAVPAPTGTSGYATGSPYAPGSSYASGGVPAGGTYGSGGGPAGTYGSGGGPAGGTYGSGSWSQGSGTGTPVPAPARPARRRKALPWFAAAVAVVVLASAAALVVTRLRSDDHTGPTAGPSPSAPVSTAPAPGPTATGPTATAPSTTPPPPVPAGYHLVSRPDHGYAVPVPDGWTRTVKDNGDEVDWVDPTGLVGLKVSALPFGSNDPYQHWVTLEPQTRDQVHQYHRERLERTTWGNEPAAIWQFTFSGSIRDFRAADLGFGKPGGTEYAVYLSAPKSQWATYLPVFQTAVDGFRVTNQ
ncbi:serine/threonine-protein kinase [Actinacidiphila acididurans]|uniref:non-specific serine/threonine protein kinase n=1 Tax=Actinacidiphila acididurans TaxID=2784346 RepID=A0ABS2TQD1_9ACTN|nr:serine/threonine-protein kinase [Actinacidiphila acididurans]MBM9504716.1 serine/threonine protein kinase [Actinacidiphila acididurans]